MLAVIAGGIAAAALLLWHLQRPARPPRALSFARFLPELPEAQSRPRRFGVCPPLRSAPFWLRMLAAALALVALTLTVERPAPQSQQVGLRVVIDVSASMALPEADGTRLAAAIAQAREVESSARAVTGTESFCAEGILVGARAARPEHLAEVLARAAPVQEGAPLTVLLEAARMPAADCALTHVLVVTDHPRPTLPWPQDGTLLLWQQVGRPLPNLSIADVAVHPPLFSGSPPRIEVAVAGWGAAPEPRLVLQGPDGLHEVPLERAGDRLERWIGVAPISGPGRYRARVTPAGAFTADADAAFDLVNPSAPVLDWRMEGIAPPHGARVDASGVLVAPLTGLSMADIADRPALLTFDGWQDGGSLRQVGAFSEDPVLLAGLNLDAFEAAAPVPLSVPLPPGFEPVLTDAATGRTFAARRASPPGFLVPAPVLSAPEPARSVSLVLFFQALEALAGQDVLRPHLDWRDSEGRGVTDAWLESDTARPLASATPIEITPRAAGAGQWPLWPLVLVAALALLLVERLWVLARRIRGVRDVL